MSLPTNFPFWNTGFLPLGEPTGRGIARRIGVAERDGFRREILIRHGSSAAGRRTTCSLHAYRVKNAGHPVWESLALSDAQPGNRMNSNSFVAETRASYVASFNVLGRAARNLDGVTDCLPILERNAQEDARHPRIIATPRPAPNFVLGLFEGVRRAIGTVRRHGVYRICNGKYSRPHRNVYCFQASRITAPIATF